MTHTTKFDQSLYKKPVVHNEHCTYLIRSLLAVAALSGLLWLAVSLTYPNVSHCSDTETLKLVSEVRKTDGSVECTYNREAARTMKEILK